LREINFGDWEGRSWSEIEIMSPEEASSWLLDYTLHPAPGGESLAQFRSRVDSQMQAIFNESREDCLAMVTHAGFIRATLVKVLGIDEKSMHKIEVVYGGVTVLGREQQEWFLEGVNLCPFPLQAKHKLHGESAVEKTPLEHWK
jgi:broad specificity phosphatase PhoE